MPKFEKGNPGGGRPEGSKNKRTQEWEALGEAIATKHAERFNTLLASCEDDKFLDKFLQVLEYFKPKLQRTEMKHEGDMSINWHEVKRYEKEQ